MCMAKTQRERAFLRDLYINDDWTKRFTDLIDKHVDFKGEKNVLYINAGTGNHALDLRERLNGDTAIFATSEDEETLSIARDKAIALKADVDFSMLRFEDDSFDTVLTDATFVRPANLQELVDESVRVARPGGDVAIMMVAAGSFGEIFSLLWEVLFNEDVGEHGAIAERLVTEIPTVSTIEEMARAAGLEKVETQIVKEVFDYDNGVALISAPLVDDFLLPEWLKDLNSGEKEKVSRKLAQLIDSEDGDLTFRFSVKATLLTGQKA